MLDSLKNPARWRSQFKTLKPSTQWMILLAFAAIMILMLGFFGGSNDPLQNESFTVLGLDVFLKLGVVLILIYIAAHFFRKFGITGIQQRTKQMTVCETLSLSPKRALYIVKVGEEQLLIGATDQNVTLIKALDPSDTSEILSAKNPGTDQSTELSLDANDLLSNK